jgi:multimeric flavodoxin WrbA
MVIIGLNGSSNKNGNTYYLLDEILKKCKEDGAETEIIDVHEAVMSAMWPFCTVCSTPCSGKCYENTKLEIAYEKIKKADALVIGSPVYFGSVSAQLKAFFDKTRKQRGEKAFIGLPGAAVTVGGSKYGGQENTIKAIHDMMLVQGMTIVGDGYFDYDAGHHGVCAQKPAQNDKSAEQRIPILAKRLVQSVRL